MKTKTEVNKEMQDAFAQASEKGQPIKDMTIYTLCCGVMGCCTLVVTQTWSKAHAQELADRLKAVGWETRIESQTLQVRPCDLPC